MIRTQIQLTDQQALELKRLAGERRVSVASLIRECVDGLLRYECAVSREELINRSLEAVGKYHSEEGDLSEHHDDYLAQAYGDYKK